MAHFAELNEANTVIRVIVVGDEHESDGEAFCQQLLGGRWKQTSYNTRGNVHQVGCLSEKTMRELDIRMMRCWMDLFLHSPIPRGH